MTIDSEPGRGTVVRVDLPRTVPPDVGGARNWRGRSVAGGGETILLVEDNDLVRAHTEAMLRGLGYAVAAAADGPSALRALAGGLRPDLLLTDVILPGGMTGRDLAEAAQGRVPGLRVLFMSGYSGDVMLENGRLPPGVDLLAKPFRRAELVAQVRARLGRTALTDRRFCFFFQKEDLFFFEKKNQKTLTCLACRHALGTGQRRNFQGATAMSGLSSSYVSAVSAVPLLGETIGAHFDRTVARWGDRPGLIVRQQGVRWSWRELAARVEAFAAGLLALGLRPGERIGIWSPNNAEWVVTQFAAAKAGLVLVNINPAYRLTELEYALNKVGCRALVTATAFKTSDYAGMLTQLAPEVAQAVPGRLRAARLPALELVIQIGARTIPAALAFADVADLGGPAERARLAALARRAAVRRADQHPVHLRHHRRAQGGDADASQHPQQRLVRRRGDAADRAGPGLHSGAAVPLLRHGDGRARLPDARQRHGVSGRGVRSAGDAGDRGGGALHRAVRRADDVHRPARPSRVRAVSTSARCAPALWPARPARSR